MISKEIIGKKEGKRDTRLTEAGFILERKKKWKHYGELWMSGSEFGAIWGSESRVWNDKGEKSKRVAMHCVNSKKRTPKEGARGHWYSWISKAYVKKDSAFPPRPLDYGQINCIACKINFSLRSIVFLVGK